MEFLFGLKEGSNPIFTVPTDDKTFLVVPSASVTVLRYNWMISHATQIIYLMFHLINGRVIAMIHPDLSLSTWRAVRNKNRGSLIGQLYISHCLHWKGPRCIEQWQEQILLQNQPLVYVYGHWLINLFWVLSSFLSKGLKGDLNFVAF